MVAFIKIMIMLTCAMAQAVVFYADVTHDGVLMFAVCDMAEIVGLPRFMGVALYFMPLLMAAPVVASLLIERVRRSRRR